MARPSSAMQRWARRVVMFAAIAFAAASVVALATHDLTAGSGDGLDTIVQVAAPSGTSVPSGEPATSGNTPGLGSSFDAGPGAGAPLDDGGIIPGGTDTVDGGAPSTAGSASSEDVAVIGPLLKVFSFGSRVGMPLLCNVGSANLATVLAPAGVSPLIATIAESCVTFGNQGSEALIALDLQLRSLAAANPVLVPAIQALADVFNNLGASGLPFADSVIALGQLIRYFSDV